MPNFGFRYWTIQTVVILAFAQAVFLNLAWNHSYLGHIMLRAEDYYAFSALPIFQYRALPSFIYCLVSFGCHAREFDLNPPLTSTYTIFQIMWDYVALNIALLALRNLLFADHNQPTQIHPLLISVLLLVWIVAFSFIFVPNRAFFYPYDFSDLACLLILAALVMRRDTRSDLIACLAICIGAFNKETVLIFPFVYFVIRMSETNFYHALKISVFLMVCGLIGKYGAVLFADVMMVKPREVGYVADQLAVNIQQLKNPLFYFALSGMSAFLYLVVIAIRRHLNSTDWYLLAFASVIFVFLFYAGIVRELRIYLPITTLFFIILARHRDAVIDLFKSRS